MKKFDISTSKILLIILGVLVAIVIGFNSKAIGAQGDYNLKLPAYHQLHSGSDELLEKASSKIKRSIELVLVSLG